jgi:hypothetical protein
MRRKEAPGVDTPQTPLVPEGAKLKKVWDEGVFTEGPAYGPDRCLYFSDIGTRNLCFDPATSRTTEYRNPSGRAKGLDFDPEGRPVAAKGANGGNRRITHTEKDGKITVLAGAAAGAFSAARHSHHCYIFKFLHFYRCGLDSRAGVAYRNYLPSLAHLPPHVQVRDDGIPMRPRVR